MTIANETQELAKWIKRTPSIRGSIPESIKSNRGKLNYIRSSAKGQEFLKERIQAHLNSSDERNSNFYILLSGYYSAVKEFSKAFKSIKKAIDLMGLDPGVRESLSTIEYIRFIRNLSDEENDALYTFYCFQMQMKNTRLSSKYELEIPFEGVEIRDYEELTTKIFKNDYCQRGIPVVIKGFPGLKWNEATLIERIGLKDVELKRTEEASDEWACLVPSRVTSVKEFIESRSDTEYLFDWGLPLHCPNGELTFETPRIFLEGDILKCSGLYRNSWPSLFVARTGMGSRCHVDAFQSHFWMYLHKGRKKWTFFHPNALPHLGPMYHSSLDPSFAHIPESKIKTLPRKEIVLEEGELLFVPYGWPHIVHNMEDSIAVSGNFVNETNLPHALNHFKMISPSDESYLDFLEELLDNGVIS